MINILMFLVLFSVINIFPLKKKSLSRATGPAVNTQAAERPSRWSGLALGRSQEPTTVVKSTSFRGSRRGPVGTGRSFPYWSKCHQHQGSLPSCIFFLLAPANKRRGPGQTTCTNAFSSKCQNLNAGCRSTDTETAGLQSSQLQLLKHSQFYTLRTENTMFKCLSSPILKAVCKCPLRCLKLAIRGHLEQSLSTDHGACSSAHSNQCTTVT